MRIKKIKIRGFGRFRDQEIDFKEGVNIILGPNESGKTTIHQFILASFYGLRKYWTKNHSYREEERLYRPLDEGPYGGSLDFEDQGTLYEIVSNFKRGEESCRVYNLSDHKEITEKLDLYQNSRSPQPGPFFLGCNEVVFRQAYFMPQMGLNKRAYGKEGLQDYFSYLQRAASSREVDRFFGEIESRERALGSEKRRTSLLGEEYFRLDQVKEKIYRVNEKIYQLKQDLAQEEDAFREEKALEEKIKDLREEIDSLKSQGDREEDPEKARIQRTYQAYKLDFLSYQEKLAFFKDLNHKGFALKDRKALLWMKNLEKRKALKWGMSLSLSLALTLVLYLLLPQKPSWPLLIFLFLGPLFIYQVKEKDLLKKYLSLEDSLKDYLEDNWSLLEEEPEALRRGYQDLLEKMEDLEETYPDLLLGEGEDFGKLARLQEDLIFLLKEKNILDQKILQIKNKREEADRLDQDRQEFEEEREALKKSLGKMETRREILLDLRDRMENILKERDSGNYEALFKEASQYFSYLTEGRYRRIYGPVKDLAFEREDGQVLDFDYLSQGTKDLAIFSLRLAMVSLAPKKLFLVMDESFNQVDQGRLKRIWALLDDLGDKMQIIYFTSRKEGIYSKKASYIELGGDNE